MDLLCNNTFCSSPYSNTAGADRAEFNDGRFIPLFIFFHPNAKVSPPFALVASCSLLVLSYFFSWAEPRCEPCQVPS